MMLVRDLNEAGLITFCQYVGDGDVNGKRFKLSVTAMPDGTLLGMPRFSFEGSSKVVTFELSDLLPTAMKAAGIEVDDG
jgi:hypothetical protein